MQNEKKRNNISSCFYDYSFIHLLLHKKKMHIFALKPLHSIGFFPVKHKQINYKFKNI